MKKSVGRWVRKGSCMLLLVSLILSLAACTGETVQSETEQTVPSVIENPMTGEELMKQLKIGWNLGNTFDAPEGETSWGNPVTTPELLKLVKDLGFQTIRIPISWGRHVSAAPEYTIDEDFMARVETVVNDALEVGLYVIINSHHDNDIYTPKPENAETAKAYLGAIWSQIAQRFQNTDHRLIFQAMNEPRVVGTAYEWTVDTRNEDCLAAMEVVNDLNQVSLDAIRAAGGYNAQRFVIVSPYVATTQAAVGSVFQLPQDSAEGKLIVSIHAYTPYNLCLNLRSAQDQFQRSHLTEIKSFLKNINYKFVQKGIPVIIDEMGCLDKKNPEARYEWAKAYVSAAAEYGIPCVWWDNGEMNGTGENFGIIDRRNLAVFADSETALQGLMDGLAGNQ